MPSSIPSLKGKVAIVTGASHCAGISRAREEKAKKTLTPKDQRHLGLSEIASGGPVKTPVFRALATRERKGVEIDAKRTG